MAEHLLPDPRPGESKDDYVERCMLSDGAREEFPIPARRVTACGANFSLPENKRLAELPTETIKAVEVMRVGVWQGQGCPTGGCKVTSEHLNNMVNAFNDIGDALQIPVKLGHDKQQKIIQKDGLPAAGWIANLRRIADVLVADFTDVPSKLAELIRAGAYKQRSSEIRDNFMVDGKRYPNVLVGVALLGADLPAVSGLDDIRAAYQAAEVEFDTEAHYSVYRMAAEPAAEEFDQAQIDGMIDSFMARISSRIKGKLGAPVIRQLARALKEGIRRSLSGKRLSDESVEQLTRILSTEPEGSAQSVLHSVTAAVRQSGDEDGASAIKEATMAFDEKALRAELGVGDDADLLEAVRERKADAGNGADEATAARLDEVEKALTLEQQKVLKLETHNEKSKAEVFADQAIRDVRILPAQREHLIAQFMHDPESTIRFVESQPKLVDTKVYGDDGAGDFMSFEPNAEQRKIAEDMDNWSPETRAHLMRQNADEAGVTIPDSYFKTDK